MELSNSWDLIHKPVSKKISPNNKLVIFEDYSFYGCEAVTIFNDELKLRDDLMFIHNLNGHAVFIKIYY